MVAGLAFVATAVATVFAQATAVRWSRTKAPHQGAWTVALALFALASAAFATGSSTGWDDGTFRIFYLLRCDRERALARARHRLPAHEPQDRQPGTGRRRVLQRPRDRGDAVDADQPATITGDALPVGKDHLDALPRALAGIGSGVGAVVLIGGALMLGGAVRS